MNLINKSMYLLILYNIGLMLTGNLHSMEQELSIKTEAYLSYRAAQEYMELIYKERFERKNVPVPNLLKKLNASSELILIDTLHELIKDDFFSFSQELLDETNKKFIPILLHKKRKFNEIKADLADNVTIIDKKIKINKVTIETLTTKKQLDSFSCGDRVLIHAQVLTAMLQENNSLEYFQENFEKEYTNKGLFKLRDNKSWLNSDSLYKCANRINLRNFYIFGINSKDISNPLILSGESLVNIFTATVLDGLFQELSCTHQNYIIHFVFNQGNHWVLVCCHKKTEGDIKIYFIDSLNRGIEQNSATDFFINNIKRSFLEGKNYIVKEPMISLEKNIIEL